MIHDVWFWLTAGVATFIVGSSKGGLPMVGILAVPLLAQVMSPVAAAGLLLPIYIISDVYGLWIYRQSFDWRNIQVLVPAAAIGVGIGWAAASITNDSMVKLLVGIIGIAYIADALLKSRRVVEPKPADLPRGLFWGTLAGFTSFVSHAGGPPYNMYVLPQKLEKMVYAGTTTIIFAIINLMKVPPYWHLGQLTVSSLSTGLVLAPLSLIGAWAGYKLTQRLPEKLFFQLVETALFLLSVKLIWDGLTALL
jgi:uncharacterized protein